MGDSAKVGHTPGPWEYLEDDCHDDERHGVIAKCTDLWIATCFRSGTETSTEAEAEANARLIAAAPELLTSLRGLLAITVHPYDGAEFEDGEVPEVDAARAAIAKATGGAA